MAKLLGSTFMRVGAFFFGVVLAYGIVQDQNKKAQENKPNRSGIMIRVAPESIPQFLSIQTDER